LRIFLSPKSRSIGMKWSHTSASCHHPHLMMICLNLFFVFCFVFSHKIKEKKKEKNKENY
jgi:hypothetical protein